MYIALNEISFLCTWQSTIFHFYVHGSPEVGFFLCCTPRGIIFMYITDHNFFFVYSPYLCIWRTTRFYFLYLGVHEISFVCIWVATGFHFFCTYGVHEISFLCIWQSVRGLSSLVDVESTYWRVAKLFNTQNKLMDVHPSDIRKIRLFFFHLKLSFLYADEISPLHEGLSRSPP